MADFTSLKQTIQAYVQQNGNEEITGNILQDVLLAMVSTMGDSAINGLASALQDETTARQNQDGTLQGNISAEATARQQADTALGGRIDGLQTAINSINTKLAEGYIYAGIATPSTNPGTPSGKVFYIAVSSGTYTNFSNLTVAQGINILKYNGSSWSKDVVYAIDARPKKNSQNFVTSGGVFDNIGALDVSELNATENPHTLAQYADLSAALAAIPTDYQKGGMSVKFVDSSDNKYIQARCMAQNFTTDTTQWAIAEEGIYVENPEFIRAELDAEQKLLGGIKKDGTYWFNQIGSPTLDNLQKEVNVAIEESQEVQIEHYDYYNVNKHHTIRDVFNIYTANTGWKQVEYDSTAVMYDELDVYQIGEVCNYGGDTEHSYEALISQRGVAPAIVTQEYVTRRKFTLDEAISLLPAEILTAFAAGQMICFTDLDDIVEEWQISESGSWVRVNPYEIKDQEGRVEIKLDNDNKIIAYRKADGTWVECVGIEAPNLGDYVEKEEGKGLINSEYAESVDVIEDPEERLSIELDTDMKILSYRDKDGVKCEEMLKVNHLELTEQGMTDFQQALKDAGFTPGCGGDYSDTITEKGKKPVFIPTPRLAMVNIIWDGNLSNLSKSDRPDGVQKVNYDVKVPVEFFDGQGVYFKKYALMSAQGNSSMDFIKKNISLKFFDTEDVEGKKKKWGKGDTFGTVFGNWVMQKTYHLKAFYTDFIRGSSEVAYQLADEVYKTRGVYADRPWKKALVDFSKITSVTPAGLSEDGINDMNLQIDNGARCMPDGFPVIVYQNGDFYGIYVWMLKKDADNFNMDTANVRHIHIDGTLYVRNLWEGNINWTAFEIRNPEDLVCMDGSDYDGDHPKELIDSTSEYYDSTDENHVRSAQVKQYIIDLSHRVGEINSLNATDSAAAKELFDTYFDADSLIDYQLINMACGDIDSFGKNWQWTTWDGVKWYVNQYDKDMAFGNHFTGMFTTAPKTGWINSNISLPSGLAIRYYQSEHKTRWQYLVNAGIFTAEHIKDLITTWVKRIGKANFENEWLKWTESPCNRPSMIDYDNWEFTGESVNGTPTSGTIWDTESNYASGDKVWFKIFDDNWYFQFKAVQANVNKPCLRGSYSVYPKSMGYRDNTWRICKYIDETIQNQNIFINTLN